MEHIYLDYDSAKIMYQKVASKPAPGEYKTEARLKTNILTSREKYLENIFWF